MEQHHRGDLIRGFTIIEMMVAIAVVAVLLGITLPALWSAKQSAIKLSCQSRMRSIGVMYQTYLAEHRDIWPTFDYELDGAGVANVTLVPAWGENEGWIILPVNEIVFWAWHLRSYAGESIPAAVEALSCPVAFREQTSVGSIDLGDALIRDPMDAPQASYRYSAALFTTPSGWLDAVAPPNVNAIHESVNNSRVESPDRKAVLSEAFSFHDRRRVKLHDGTVERFNVLAADGHVDARKPDSSKPPMGFYGESTGLESPPLEPDEYAERGLPFISTFRGAAGVDW